MKFDPKELLSAGAIPGAGIAGPGDWLAKVNEIIAGINQLIQHYGQLRKNFPGIAQRQPGGDLPPAGMIPPAEDPTAKMLLAARLFLGNLQNQGMGDQPMGQVISQIPETVNQIAAGLDNLIARAGGAKGITG